MDSIRALREVRWKQEYFWISQIESISHRFLSLHILLSLIVYIVLSIQWRIERNIRNCWQKAMPFQHYFLRRSICIVNRRDNRLQTQQKIKRWKNLELCSIFCATAKGRENCGMTIGRSDSSDNVLAVTRGEKVERGKWKTFSIVENYHLLYYNIPKFNITNFSLISDSIFSNSIFFIFSVFASEVLHWFSHITRMCHSQCLVLFLLSLRNSFISAQINKFSSARRETERKEITVTSG